MIIAEVSITPLGKGESVSEYVAEAVKAFREMGVKHTLTPMATVLEVENLGTLWKAVEEAEKRVFQKGAKRVVVSIKIDHRIDREATMEKKVRSVEEKL